MRDLTRRSSAVFQLVSVAIVLLFCSTAIGTILISEAGNPSIGIYLDGSMTNVGQTSSMASANKILFWTQIAPVNQEAAIQAGTIDGDVSWEPYCSAQVIDNAAKILVRSGNITPDHPSDLLAVHYNNQFSHNETNQQLVARVVRAHLEATDWIVRTINEGAGANYSILVQIAARFTGLSQSDIQSALEHVGYKSAINQSFKDGLADFTSMFANLSMIVGFGGYSDATDFANGITNTSYQDMSSGLSPSGTILGTVRIGYLNGNLRSLAEVVAKNASLWGGKDLFQVWGVDVTSPIPYATSGQEMDAFAAGNIDMGYLGCAASILKCINANIPIEIVSAANIEGSAILVRPDISTLDDLNLRTFATPGPSSIEHLLLLKWAAINGFEVYWKGTVEVPSAPQDLNATASNGNITLRWLEPENSGGTSITNYTIYRGTSSGGESILATIGVNLSFVDSSVIQGSTYYYKVSAINLVGEGAQSNETSARVDVTDTTPPVVSFIIQRNGTNVVTAQENQTLVLTANATYDVNDSFGSLNFTWSFGDSTTGYGPWVRHTYTAIKTFSIKLGVRDSVGNGANLTKSLIITPSPRPDLRIISMAFLPTVFTVGNQGRIRVNIGNIGNDVAVQPTLGFYLQDSEGTMTFIGNATYFTVNGIAAIELDVGQYGLFNFDWTPGSPGNLTILVRAAVEREINTADNADTGYVIVEAPIGFASEPRNLTAIAGFENVTLTWGAPAYSNASAVSGYMISYGISPDLLTNQITWDQFLYVLDGLKKGQVYYFCITAQNDAGWGPNSTIISATPFGVPSVPLGFVAIAGNGNISLNWTAPLYLGPGTITYYLFRDGVEVWSGTVLAYLDTPLTKGLQYSYTVVTQNLIGWGQNCSAILRAPIGTPSSPIGLMASPGAGFINLNWTAPSYVGPAILIYHLFRDGVEIWNGTATTLNDSGLVNGHAFDYYVAASNSVGWGANSTSVQATTPIAPVAPSDNILLYIGIGVIAIIALAGVAFLVLRKRK